MDGMALPGTPETRGIADVAPWPDWPAAADGALAFLHEQLGWDLWAVTRIQAGAQVVLRAFPDGAVPPGAALPWDESFCRQMVEGAGPRVATVTAAVPAYARCSAGLAAGVAAYLGVPLVGREGELFGTLCAIAFRAQPLSAARGLATAEFVARMLSTLLTAGQEHTPDEQHLPVTVS
jgi:GAF domain-containing protein